jgi:hypothetical protein
LLIALLASLSSLDAATASLVIKQKAKQMKKYFKKKVTVVVGH